MLLVCLAIYVGMLMIISSHYDRSRGTSKIIAVFSCQVLFAVSFKIKKTED